MKAEKISATCFFTYNLGNYNNIKIEAGIEGSLEPNETVEDAFKKAWTIVEKEVHEKLDIYSGKEKVITKGRPHHG